MRFRLLDGGIHVGEDGKKYKPGDEVTSSKQLDKLFVGRFALVSGVPDEDRDVGKAPDIPTPKKKPEKKKPEKQTDHGELVSNDFPLAKIAELDVYKKGNWFSVIDPETNEQINTKKLRQNKVEDFLSEYVEDDDEDEEEDV